jgi:hypothetical protein
MRLLMCHPSTGTRTLQPMTMSETHGDGRSMGKTIFATIIGVLIAGVVVISGIGARMLSSALPSQSAPAFVGIGPAHFIRASFGCRTEQELERLIEIAGSGDQAAFKTFTFGTAFSGRCVLFSPGDDVFLEGYGSRYWASRVRRPGEIASYFAPESTLASGRARAPIQQQAVQIVPLPKPRPITATTLPAGAKIQPGS